MTTRGDLLNFALGGGSRAERERIAEALTESPDLQRELNEVLTTLEALVPHGAETDEIRRERLIQAALRAAKPERRRASPWVWGTLGLTGLAAVAAIAIILPLRTVGPRWQSKSVQVGESVVATLNDERVELDAGTLVAKAGASVKLERREGSTTRWSLDRGRVELDITPDAGRAIAIATEEGTAEVRGTLFSVERERDATEIAVTRGSVAWTERGTERSGLLRAGERIRLGAPTEPNKPLEPAEEEVDELERVEPVEPTSKLPVRARAPKAREIRAQIQAGATSRARRMLERAQKASRRDPELAMVAAEIDLAEKRYRAALKGYLTVVDEFSGTATAESALFAAAQLAVERTQLGTDGQDLLRRYQRLYPAGRFILEVESLLIP